jgi:glycosyltransferase involved in cell wall biosynthesis
LGFRELIRRYQPDLLHVQNFAPWKKTIPIVLTVHDLCFKTEPKWFSFKTRLAFQFFFKHSLNLADIIICVSKNTKKQLLNYYSVSPAKIRVVYEAAANSFYYISVRSRLKEELKQKFELNKPYFLIVGNVEQRKQPELIISAFKKTLKQYSNMELVFVGPNKLKLKAQKQIKFLNYVSDTDLNLLYNGATALIYFSLCEGFGLPIVEAMACRAPIICSDIPVFREIAVQSALFVRSENELSKAMENLIKDKSLRYEYSKLAYQRSSYFSWQKAAKQSLAVYQDLV